MKEKLKQTDIFSIDNTEDVGAQEPQTEFVLTTPVTQEEMQLRAKNRARKEEDVPKLNEPQPQVPTPPPAKPLTAIQLFNNSLEAYKKQVLPNLLSKHNIEPAQFVQIVVSELKKNPKLIDAFKENPSSLFASILAGAEIGLIPSDMLGEFYLIPRRIDGKQTVTPLIGYKGLVSILLRSGEITKIHTECVFEGDHFEAIYGLEQNIIHKPNFDTERSANTLKFVYAVAKLKNGDYQFQVLSKGEILKIKALSRYDNDLYFNDKKDPQMWMVRKTALIQLSKMLPKDFYGKKAVEMDGQLEGGAILSLDEENNIKIIDGKKVTSLKQASVINTINSLPEIPE
jgi:recombination protein RecT